MLLELNNITKDFRSTRALENVDFNLREGEVHVLFGENGAGKSTLINIIAGMFPPSEGTVLFIGEQIRDFEPHISRSRGISSVFQEFSLVGAMSVVDNIFLGRELRGPFGLDRRAMMEKAQNLLDGLGYSIDLSVQVDSLPRAEQQMVEIAKALLLDARVLILDEPTASLTDEEADHLLAIVHNLTKQGVGVIYVSHRMREINAIADRITVLRSGKLVGTIDAKDASESELVSMMTGRELTQLFPAINHACGEVALTVCDLTSESGGIADVSLDVRAGEVVGIAGLVGCGKGAVGRTIFGLETFDGGEIFLGSRQMKSPTPAYMLEKGVCYFPSDRNDEGLAINLRVSWNVAMASLDLDRFNVWGFLQKTEETKAVQNSITKLSVRPDDLNAEIGELSGGNRQKAMLARGLMRDVSVFIFDEPTVGIDVGAKAEIYQLIGKLVAAGAAVILISSELIEVLNLSNRVYVMHEGRMVAELEGEQKTQERVLQAFFGHSQDKDFMEQVV